MLALKSAGFSLADVERDVLLPSRMHSYFCTQPLSPLTNIFDVLWYVCSRVNDALHQVAGVADICVAECTHIPASVAKFVVHPISEQTQIERDKIQCFLLKELNCFTNIEWRQNESLYTFNSGNSQPSAVIIQILIAFFASVSGIFTCVTTNISTVFVVLQMIMYHKIGFFWCLGCDVAAMGTHDNRTRTVCLRFAENVKTGTNLYYWP